MTRRAATWLLWPVLLVGLGAAIESNGWFEETRFAVSRNVHLMPSTRAAPAREVLRGHPVLSIHTDAAELHDPERGILAHPTARGRDWERFAYVSYFDDAALQFATGVGLRVHGGRSREVSAHKSFGLFFRRRYGAAPEAPVFFDGPAGALARVVVHNDVRHDRAGRAWHLVNPLAYDIARRLGAIAPRTRPVRFFLNGELQGVYVLTEHIGPAFFEARFGHSDFGLDDDGSEARLLEWARGIDRMTIDAVSSTVDLDNLTRWAISMLFCGTTDIWQGQIARDRRDPDSRWFWVNWDMDHSFMDLYQRAEQPWGIDTYRSLLGSMSQSRSYLLTRLISEDPAYRARFASLLAGALNHRLTPAFLQSRLAHYRLEAAVLGIETADFLDVIEQFFTHRPAVVRELTRRLLELGPESSVSVELPAGRSVVVDGQPVAAAYRGLYFPETPVIVEVPAEHRRAFVGWTVNGRPAGHDWRLQISPRVTTSIVAQFRQ